MGARRGRAVAATVALTVALALATALVSGCGRISQSPLAASRPPEQVLRTLRLAGVARAEVAEEAGVVTVALTLPAAQTPGDVALGWLIGWEAARAAYPDARSYRVGVRGPGAEPLLDAESPRDAASFAGAAVRYGTSATAPTRDAEPGPRSSGAGVLGDPTTAAYLDAKNAAAGVDTTAGPEATALTAAIAEVRAAWPGVPAPDADSDAGVAYALRIVGLLENEPDPTAVALRNAALDVRPGLPGEEVARLRLSLLAVEAVGRLRSLPAEDAAAIGAARGAIADLARGAAGEPVRRGPLADAVLAAAGDREAPDSARIVTDFERAPALDAANAADGDALPNRVLAASRAQGARTPEVAWPGGRVAPDRWLAFTRPGATDEAVDVFWLAGDAGPVALTDGSAIGFAWQTRTANLVDADDVGRILGEFRLP